MKQKVTIKVAELVALRGTIKDLTGTPMPVKQGIRVAKLAEAMQRELKIIEDARVKVIQQCGGKLDTKTNMWSATPEICGDKWPEFMKEYNELMADDVEMDVEPVSFPDSLSIPPAYLMLLEPFFEHPEDPVKQAEKIIHG